MTNNRVSKSLKEITEEFRQQLKDKGIQARCRMTPGNIGSIQIYPVRYELSFDEATQRTIRQMAVDRGMTWVAGLKIDVEQMTDAKGMEFYPS